MMPQNVNQSCRRGVDELGATSCLDLVSMVRDTSIPVGIPKRRPAPLPNITLVMPRRYVDGRYVLGLPRCFCESHLPKCDDKIMLVSKDNKEYITEFTASNCTLGGDGWKEFAISKELVHGDAIVLEKDSPLKFKVTIRKGPPSLPKSSPAQQGLGSFASPRISAVKNEASEDIGRGSCHMDVKKTACSHQLVKPDNRSLQTNNSGTTNLRSNYGGTNFFDFSNFKTDLSASDVLMKLEEDVVIKYYELCCSQKMYLHSNLLGVWNSKFIAAMILEIVDIAEAIRCSNLNTPRDMYKKWHIKLYQIECLGMEVGFIQRRLQKLSALACNPNREAKRKKMEEARAEKDNIEAKLKQMQETLYSLNEEIAGLETEEDNQVCTYLDEARAWW